MTFSRGQRLILWCAVGAALLLGLALSEWLMDELTSSSRGEASLRTFFAVLGAVLLVASIVVREVFVIQQRDADPSRDKQDQAPRS